MPHNAIKCNAESVRNNLIGLCYDFNFCPGVDKYFKGNKALHTTSHFLNLGRYTVSELIHTALLPWKLCTMLFPVVKP